MSHTARLVMCFLNAGQPDTADQAALTAGRPDADDETVKATALIFDRLRLQLLLLRKLDKRLKT